MGNKRFLKHLRKEIPEWIENGWIKASDQQSILEHVASKGKDNRLLTYSLTIIGVLLLGSGIITFFAANWAVIPKLIKLALLFSAMWVSYTVAGYILSRRNYQNLGQAVLLLGVILFGAGIMLIAQIYHINSHYPNGVFLWALGALATAYLMNSQPCLIAAIVLATLWNTLETTGFTRTIHWWYLLFWAACLPFIYLRQWRPSGHMAMIGLLLWSLISFVSINKLWPGVSKTYFIQIYFLVYLGLLLIGMTLKNFENFSRFSNLIQRYCIFAVLVNGYLLTYPVLQSGMRGWRNDLEQQIASAPIIAITLLSFFIVGALAFWSKKLLYPSRKPAYYLWGVLNIGAGIVTILANLFLPRTHGGIIAMVFNLLFFITLIWLIYTGTSIDDRFIVNLAFVFFAIGLLSRYVDTFWSLMDRSFFFMGGGLILVVGGFYWEKKRREMTRLLSVNR